MTYPLSTLLHSLQLAGLDIDAEAALDAVWLGLRMREHALAAAAARADARQTMTDVGPVANVGGVAPLATDATAAGAVARDARLTRTGEFATPLPPSSNAALARSLTLSRATALPDSRGLIRALRPLRRRVATPGSRMLDIDTTVRRAAEEDLWIPSFEPTRERWLDVLLVADHGLSMIIWKDTIDEFERVLRNSGAFRTVRSWWLESDVETLAVSARGRGPSPATPVALTQLVRSPARSVILLISDCVGPRWHDGAIPNLMSQWSRHLPLALLQVTPEWFWARTALGDTVDSRFRSPVAAAVNQQFSWDATSLGAGGVSSATAKTLLRVPAATLTSDAVARLADLIAGVGREWAPGVVFDLTWEGDGTMTRPSAATAGERVARFLVLASKDAKRLAASYAASPVRTLGVLRLLRRDLLPEASAFAEAEVLLGGIVRVRREDARWDLGASVPLDFFPGVQPLLLDGALAGDVVRVLAHAATVAASGLGPTFTSWLTNPSSGEAQLDPTESPLAAAAAATLTRLGGDFARIVMAVADAPHEAMPNEFSNEETHEPDPNVVVTMEFMVSGRIAGVGYRTYAQNQARQLGLQGTAENLPDGRAKVVATGPRGALRQLEALLRQGPQTARVEQVVARVLPSEPEPRPIEANPPTPQPANAPPRSEWPSWELLLDEKGQTVERGGEIASAIRESRITDLFILIHGWNVDHVDARAMFQRFRASAEAVAHMPWIRSARVGTLGVIWPSIAWPDDDDVNSVASGEPPVQLEDPKHQKDLEEATRVVNANPDDPTALERLSGLVRNVSEGNASPTSGAGSPKGLAGFVGSLWQGAKSALRTTSYFQMQKRAAVLGRDGLRPFLGQLAEHSTQMRAHLVAHSVGARLAAHALAALDASDQRATAVQSLSLLQGVLSHHAFAPTSGPGNARPGALTGAIRRVDGPVIVTYSRNDKAAGVAYETATRVAGDEDAPGEARTAIGALGHDGARSPNAVELPLRPVGSAYDFKSGLIFNVDASAVIAAHSDVFRPEIAWLVLSAAGEMRLI